MIHTTLDDLINREVAPALVGTGIDAQRVGEVLRGRDLIRYVRTGNLSRDGLQLVADDATFWEVARAVEHEQRLSTARAALLVERLSGRIDDDQMSEAGRALGLFDGEGGGDDAA